LSTVTVSDRGTLAGSGSIGALVSDPGGTVAPGPKSGIGTLHVAGAATFHAGSIYQVQINPGGQADLIDVAGAAMLNGGAVSVRAAAGGFAFGTRYTILTAQGGVTGRFDGAAGPSQMPFLDFELVYDPAHVYLDVARSTVTFASVGATRNQTATGGGADHLPVDHAVVAALMQLDVPQARRAFDQLSGEIHGSTKTTLIGDSRIIRNAVYDRIRAAFSDAGATLSPVLAYGPEERPMAVAATHAGPVFWANGFGAWGSTESDGNAASFDRDIGGMLMGVDAAFGDWRAGILGGYSHSTFKIHERASSGTSDNYHLGLYGGTNWAGLAVRTGVAYTWHNIETSRGVVFPGFAERLRADYAAGAFQAFGELAHGFGVGSARLEPFANVAYVNLRTAGFNEKGGNAALSGLDGSTDVTYTTLGLRGEHAVTFGPMNGRLKAMIGWRHAFGDTIPESTHAFSVGSGFTIAGAPIAKNTAAIEAGVELIATSDATFGLSYQGQIASSAQDHGFKANFAARF